LLIFKYAFFIFSLGSELIPRISYASSMVIFYTLVWNNF
jgi:hypothetical protein